MTTYLEYWTKSLALGLSFLITLPHAHAQTMPTELNIVVLEGEGATNNVRQRVARDPVVRVEDENHKPIVGAAVVFTLPTEGATGEFANGAKSLTIMTDSQGQATAQSLKMNPVAGKVPIHVNASYRGLTARTSITQFTVLPPGAKASSSSSGRGGHGGLITVLVVLGAAAAGGGAYFATRSSGSAVNPPPTVAPIGITAGAGTIVGGR